MLKLGQKEPDNIVVMYCGACGTYMEAEMEGRCEIMPLEIEGCDHFNMLNFIKFQSCCGKYSNCNDFDGFFYIGGAYHEKKKGD